MHGRYRKLRPEGDGGGVLPRSYTKIRLPITMTLPAEHPPAPLVPHTDAPEGTYGVLRIKTCGHGAGGFQFGSRRDEVGASDFTVLVRMGEARADDQFYVVPTNVVRSEVSARAKVCLAQLRKDGTDRKDTGRWTSRFKFGRTASMKAIGVSSGNRRRTLANGDNCCATNKEIARAEKIQSILRPQSP